MGRSDTSGGLARDGVDRVLTRVAVTLRLVGTAVAVGAAATGYAPPARAGWVVAGVAGLLVWSGLYAYLMVRRRSRAVPAVGDVLVVVLLCLAHPRLVPAEVLAAGAGTGWVDIVAGAGVFIAQFGMRQPAGLAAGMIIAAAYTLGLDQVREAGIVLVVQAMIAAAITTLLRRAARAADAALADEAASRDVVLARAAVRADERHQQRQLHDTVLATLTMVNTGGIDRDSVALRQRARADLIALRRLRARAGTPAVVSTARLDLALRGAALIPRPGLPRLEVTVDVPPVELPRDVVDAMGRCAAEALTNVARHSGTRAARISAQPTRGGITVAVADDGVGFDLGAVPAHRRGIRESIDGRMRVAGGAALVMSRPGRGTEVRLRWPDA